MSSIFDKASFLCYQTQHSDESFRYYFNTFCEKTRKTKNKYFGKNIHRIHNRKTSLGLPYVKEGQMLYLTLR